MCGIYCSYNRIEKRRKLNSKLVFLGYADGRKAYRVLNPENDTILISRDAKFVEVRQDEMPRWHQEEFPGEETEVSVVPKKNKEEVVVLLEAKKIEEIDPVPEVEESDEEYREEFNILDYPVTSNASSFKGFPMDEIARRSKRKHLKETILGYLSNIQKCVARKQQNRIDWDF